MITLRPLKKSYTNAPVILVMDEDRDFLADCVGPLTQAGFEVLTAIDSQELHYLCELYPRPIDVCVLDIPLGRDASLEDLLPRQYGNKMVSLIRVTRPASSLLLTSVTPAWKHSRHRLGGLPWQLPFLQRPCTAQELVQKVESLLPTTPDAPLPPAMYLRQCA
jgi:DNA-binding response OmpR family regulator